MTSQRIQTHACLHIPNLAGGVKRSCSNSVAVGIVKTDAVDDICVALKRLETLARFCVPQLAGSIVAPCDELTSVLVEGAVS